MQLSSTHDTHRKVISDHFFSNRIKAPVWASSGKCPGCQCPVGEEPALPQQSLLIECLWAHSL